jgi:hypothetical protein
MPPLLRPFGEAEAVIDSRSQVTAEGWPIEIVRAGSLRALVSLACYYTTRRKRPELLQPGARAPVDQDFVDVFWRSCSSLAPIDAVASAFVAAASAVVVAAVAAGGDGGCYALQLCDGLCGGINARADYLGYLTADEQCALLAAAKSVYYMLLPVSSQLQPADTADAIADLGQAVADAEAFVDALAARGFVAATSRRTVQAVRAEIVDGIVQSDSPAKTGAVPGSGAVSLLLGGSVSARALADAWAILDESLFLAIPPREWFGCGWDSPRFMHAADGVRAFVDKYNSSSLWVSTEVLGAGGVSGGHIARAAVITIFVQVAHHLRRLNDFSGASSVLMGLKREAVARLSAAWSLVPSPAVARYTMLLRELEDKEQYKKYKEALRLVPGTHPVVPHLGAHTAEMTAAEMNLPALVEAVRGGPATLISIKRPRELWLMAAPLVRMQDAARSYAATGVIPSNDRALSACLRTALTYFYITTEEERDAVLERLEARSKAVEPVPAALNQDQARALFGVLVREGERELASAKVSAPRAVAAVQPAAAGRPAAPSETTSLLDEEGSYYEEDEGYEEDEEGEEQFAGEPRQAYDITTGR